MSAALRRTPRSRGLVSEASSIGSVNVLYYRSVVGHREPIHKPLASRRPMATAIPLVGATGRSPVYQPKGPTGDAGRPYKPADLRWAWGPSSRFAAAAPTPRPSPRRKPGPIFQRRPSPLDPGLRRDDIRAIRHGTGPHSPLGMGSIVRIFPRAAPHPRPVTPGESRGPYSRGACPWIPALAGMTTGKTRGLPLGMGSIAHFRRRCYTLPP